MKAPLSLHGRPLYCPGESAHGSYSPSGLLESQATMWNTAVGWLTGAQPPSSGGFCNLLTGTHTWHCDFTKDGTSYSMVWDNSNSQNAQQSNYCATTFANPYVCGNTRYSPPLQYTRWIDLSGTVRAMSQAVPFVVGLNPVLLEP